MRVFLLPISTKRTLIYCQRINQVTSEQKSLVDKATSRAAKIWVGWEKGERKWQKSVTAYGNQLLQRISYEEWGLKSIPPLSARRKTEELAGKEKVEVTFPGNKIRSDQLQAILRRHATSRQALHKSRLWWSIVGMPITAPVALVPIVPNLPFFYLVYRAWSHWRALSGSKHLEFLLDNKLIKALPSIELEEIYRAAPSAPSAPSATEPERQAEKVDKRESASFDEGSVDKTAEESMLLGEADASLVASTLDAPELAMEIERAVRQVTAAIKTEKQKEMEKEAEESKSEAAQEKEADPKR